MTTTIGSIEGTSSERGRLVHVARSLLVAIPLALLLTVLAAATGRLDLPWSGANNDLTLTGSTGDPAGGNGGQDPNPPVSNPDQNPTPDIGSTTTEPDAGSTTTEPDVGSTTTGPAGQPDGEPATIRVVGPGTGASRLITGPVERVVDTRPNANTNGNANDEASGDGSTIDLPAPADLDRDGEPVTALVLSVSLMGNPNPGSVTIEGPFGSINAVTADGPGATTTSLVVVPGRDPARLVNTAGGAIIVDLVGRFVESGAVAEGRFVTTDPVRLARLVTATDGRETEVDLGPAIGAGGASAALVLITADVGDEGGRIAIGPAPDQLDQLLMWGPPSGTDRQRRGVALVAPGEDGRFALRYDGGSILDVDLLGYATSASAPTSTDGLFVPASTILTVDRRFPVGTTVIDGLPAGFGAAFVGLRAEPGAATTAQAPELARDLIVASGRTIGTVLPAGVDPTGRPGVAVTSQVELGARLQIFGYFLDLNR